MRVLRVAMAAKKQVREVGEVRSMFWLRLRLLLLVVMHGVPLARLPVPARRPVATPLYCLHHPRHHRVS